MFVVIFFMSALRVHSASELLLYFQFFSSRLPHFVHGLISHSRIGNSINISFTRLCAILVRFQHKLCAG